jgi:phosphoribulokinase
MAELVFGLTGRYPDFVGSASLGKLEFEVGRVGVVAEEWWRRRRRRRRRRKEEADAVDSICVRQMIELVQPLSYLSR